MQQRVCRLLIRRRDDRLLQRLTHVLLGAFTQTENHTGGLLCQVHLTLKVEVDERFVGFRPLAQVNGLTYQVAIETIGIERRIRRHQLGYGLQTGVQRLIRCLLVGIHLAAPETFAVQTYVPVAQVILYEVRDSTTGFGWFIRLIRLRHLLYERVEFGENPAVDLGTILARRWL